MPLLLAARRMLRAGSHPNRFALFCLLVLCVSSFAYGQSLAGLGALNGTVKDPSGAVIAGADVELTNPSLGVDRKLKATSDGLFLFPSLQPAPGYVITVTSPGFGTAKVEKLVVHVGEQLAVPVSLAISSTQNVTVSENTSPIVDTAKTEVSGLVNEAQIMDLPINGRRADQFALLTPGVVQDGTNGDISFHGVPAGNQFLQDGVDVTQQWFVANAGGGGGGIASLSNISMDAVQEFRTEDFGYSAEFGRGAGGVVNTVTKSGTNEFHGGAFWFFRNRTLNATDLFSTRVVNGVKVPYNPPEFRHQFGGSVGGPIIKDKLFFFGAYEGTIRNFPLVSSIINTSILDNNGNLLPSACAATAAQCSAANAFLRRFFTTVSRSLSQNDGFFKLDYRQNEKSSWMANFNLLQYYANHGGVTSAAPTDGSGAAGSNYNVSTHIRNGHLSNTYILTPRVLNEARLGWNADRRFQGLPTDLLPPDNILSGLTVAGQANLGVSQNALPNVQPSESRFTFDDTMSIVKGKHQMKYGTSLAYLRSYENGIFSGPGAYTYANFTQFAYDLTPSATDPTSAVSPFSAYEKHYQSFAQALGHPITRITIRDYDFFAQDAWQVTQKLLLNLGLRYEYVTFTQPPPPSYAALAPNVGPINQPKLDFAPRVGFSYAPYQGLVVRGNYGIFFNRMPGAAVTRLQQLGGTVRKSFTLSNTNATQFAAAPTFPNRFSSLDQVNAILSPSTINSGFAKPGLSTPYVQEWSLGVEQALSKNMSLAVSYVGSRGVKFLQRSDLNNPQPSGIDTYYFEDVNGNVTGQSVGIPSYYSHNSNPAFDPTFNPNYSRILQIDNGGRLWYDGLIVEFHQRESRYIQSTAAYTWSHSLDLGQGTSTSNYYFTDQGDTFYNGISTINGRSGYSYEKGRSLEDQRHRLVLTAIAQSKLEGSESAWVKEALSDWQLAPIFTLASSQGVDTYVTPGGLGSTDPRLYYSTSLSGIGAETPGANRAPFLPTANLPLGHTVQLDARVTKVFKLHESQSIQLSFEAINALNHIRITGVNQTGYSTGWNATTNTGIIKAVTGVGTGTASGGFPDGTNARRAQASFRYTF